MKLVVLCLLLCACGGNTGGLRVTFSAFASGPSDAAPALAFDTRAGYHVVLDHARLHIGALYFNEGQPIAGAQETGCVLQSTYVAQVVGSCDVDLLSPAPVAFAVAGSGLARPAATGEVWYADGDVNATDDTTQILVVSGTATKGTVSYPFNGTVTIGKNRDLAPLSPAQPGSHPICKQRIVSGVSASFTPANGGAVHLRVDPRPWFATLDFSRLPAAPQESSANSSGYVIADALSDTESAIFFGAFRAHSGYQFAWTASAP